MLFFHELSHALLGASIAYILLPHKTWKYRMLSVVLGALAGLSPDLYGARDLNPWSHAILFSPLTGLWVALIGKLVLRRIPFKVIWGTSIVSLLIGHLLLDYMGHEVTLFFPFSRESVIGGAVTLGDPWIWLPLLIGLLIGLPLKYKSKMPVIIALIFVVFYLIFRLSGKVAVEHEIRLQYANSTQPVFMVEPEVYYDEYPLNPFKWLQFRFIILNQHRNLGGSGGIFGENIITRWNIFYPNSGELNYERNRYWRVGKQDELSFNVINELRIDDRHYLLGTNKGKTALFKEIEVGYWDEVFGSEKEIIIQNLGE